MQLIKAAFLLMVLVAASGCTLEDQRFFLMKEADNPYPIIGNPYLNPTQ